MHTLFVHPFFSERIVRALCWTLVHSLWQGLLLAILTGVVILMTRRSGPSVRYALFSGSFLLFFLGSCLTFAIQYRQAADPGYPVAMGVLPDRTAPPELITGGAPSDITVVTAPAITGRLVDFFNAHAGFLVAVWFIIFSMRLVQIIAQLGAVQRLRHYRTHAPTAYWKDKLQELAERLQIRIPVTLLESELVKAPMMAGFIKPVILLPFSLVCQLPAQQVEAILLHELAHIRRRDYIVNLIQSFAEILFFFNPGVLWISTLIREERENCCDDMAIGQAGNKKEFVHALVSFQEYRQGMNKYALAFPGTGNHLLQRVKRIVYRDNKTLDMREKFFLICCLVITGALTLAFSGSSQTGKSIGTVSHVLRDSIPNEAVDTSGVIMAAPVTKKEMTRKREQAELKERAEQKEIAERAAALAQKDTVEQQYIEAKIAMDRVMANADRKEAIEKMEPVERKEMAEAKDMAERNELAERKEMAEQKELAENQAIYGYAQDQFSRKLFRDSADPIASADRKEQIAKINEARMKLKGEEMELSAQRQQLNEQERVLNQERKKLEEQQRMAMIDQQESVHKQVESKQELLAELQTRTVAVESRKVDQDQYLKKTVVPVIADQLLKDKLIDSKDEFSIELDKDALTVNGVRQPADVFQRYKEMYLKGPKDEIFITRKKNGTGSMRINITTDTTTK